MKKQRQAKLVRELNELDHCFLSKKGVERFTKPFGFTGSTYLAKANPQDFKGLSLYDKDDNPIKEADEWRWVIGQDASIVAIEIAEHLGVEYDQMYSFGRGSQLRSACSAILEHLNKKVIA
jgi:hypothetical protein